MKHYTLPSGAAERIAEEILEGCKAAFEMRRSKYGF